MFQDPVWNCEFEFALFQFFPLDQCGRFDPGIQIEGKSLDCEVIELKIDFLVKACNLREIERLFNLNVTEVDTGLERALDDQPLVRKPFGIGRHFAHQIF